MKRRVETGDLRHVRHALHDQADGPQIVGLVQRGERNQLFQLRQNLRVHPDRMIVFESAMADTVAHAGQVHPTGDLPQKHPQVIERSLVPQLHTPTPGFLADHATLRVLGDEAGRSEKALKLSAKLQFKFLPLRGEDRKLHTRRACVDDEDRFHNSFRPPGRRAGVWRGPPAAPRRTTPSASARCPPGWLE